MQIPSPRELFDFSGKVVLVTGAGSGIGRGIALRFGQAGAGVSLHYHNSERGAREVAEAIAKMGGRTHVLRADLRRAENARTMIEETVKNLGALDVLVNNAGIYPVAPILELSAEEWRDVMAANLDCVHYCTQAAARVMRQRGGGAIVNIA